MPSLYANYLDSKQPSSSSPATISSEPVKYSFKGQQEAVQEEKKAPDAALRFQPVKRPQLQQKPKSRPIPSSTSPDKLPNERKPPSTAPTPGISIDNWIHDEEEEDPFAAQYLRRKEEERLQRKKDSRKRKKKSNTNESRHVDWDAIYDPEFPVPLADYKGSEEEVRAEHDWKQRLHAHQIKARQRERRSESTRQSSVEQQSRPAFAPPASYNFAPPTTFDTSTAHSLLPSSRPADDDDYESYEPPPPAPVVYNDQTGEDAYTRRMRLVGGQPPTEPPTFVPTPLPAPAPPLNNPAPLAPPSQPMQIPGLTSTQAQSGPMLFANPSPAVAATASATGPVPSANTISRQPVRYEQPASTTQQDTGTISREPVRYERQTQSTAEDELEESERHGGLGSSTAPGADDVMDDEALEEEPRSNRPGQKDFAKRLLARYGWKTGEGLGADKSGIITPLQHQVQKRKKKPDAEGGGWAQPAAMGRIIGGKRQKLEVDAADTKFSVVAKFEGMIDDMDLDHAIQEENLMQTLGERMATYGHVERLYIDRAKPTKEPVFVKFTSQLSAYRAIEASNEKDFLGNGRLVRSSFYDDDKFEEGIYD